jgi:DUF1680 family protein
MRAIILVLLAGAVSQVVEIPRATAPAKDYPIAAVPLTAVKITDRFWAPRMDINRTVTIPHIMRENEMTGRVDNFLKAAHKKEGAYQGQRYNDTDVYKVIEAASWTLARTPDPALDKKVDDLIAVIAAAQEPDGYLYTPRTADAKNPAPGAGPERWSWLHTSHELYDQGHMIEAAVAHYSATGKRNFLEVAIKSADLICRTFGPNLRRDVPGHEEIELALVKLFRVTGNRQYLDTARFFVEERGRQHGVEHPTFEKGNRFYMYNDLAYRQDQAPVVDQHTAVGHAVRATYLYSAMTDIATLFGDTALWRTVQSLFADVTDKKMYVTGGLGAVAGTEAFGADYTLPNRAYAETCASVGGMLWYHRMFLRDGDGSHYDALERTLYNGYLSGVSLSGDRFFYQNPLVSDGRQERQQYFDVACCPANLSRLMAELPGLIYAQQGNRVYVNLFIGSEANITVKGVPVKITQVTNYPWAGKVTVHVDPQRPVPADLYVRVPDWARREYPADALYRLAPLAPARMDTAGVRTWRSDPAGYRVFARTWKAGDTVTITLPMDVRRVLANDNLVEDRGKAAIQRGPIVYCLEGVDNGGSLKDVKVPLDAPATERYRADLLNGVETITFDAAGRTVTAIPYFAWNNRGKGEMTVWIPY